MPGQGMTDYAKNAITIAKAGIYDLRLHHDAVIQLFVPNEPELAERYFPITVDHK
jgi:hypothetical protein